MADFPEKAEDNVNVLTTVIIGGVSAIVLWAGVIALQAYYDATGGEIESARFVANQARDLRQARSEHLADLVDYRYVDTKSGTVKLPIERAMALVSEDARRGASTLVPAVGAHDTPTVPLPGQTMDAPAAPADPEAMPTDAEGVEGVDAPTDAEDAKPADPASPASGGTAAPANAETAAAPAKPAPATARAEEAAPAPAEEGSAN